MLTIIVLAALAFGLVGNGRPSVGQRDVLHALALLLTVGALVYLVVT